jgi:YD repeat-containing protein
MTDPLNQEETYTYDLNGNLTGKTNRNGNTLTMTYDGLSRLLSQTVQTPDGTGDATYTYNLIGNIRSMSGGGIDTTYSYDELGRVIKESGSDGTEQETSYDSANNRTRLVIKVGGTVKTNTTYTYDKLDRLYQVSENGQLQATYTYDENGNRVSLTYTVTAPVMNITWPTV